MASECVFCGVRRYIETNILVLNGGKLWVEFCQPCGETHILTNEKGEHWLVRELFASSRADHAGVAYVRTAEDIAEANRLWDVQSHCERIDDDYTNDLAWREAMDAEIAERTQLLADETENLIDRQLHSRRFKPHADALRLLAA